MRKLNNLLFSINLGIIFHIGLVILTTLPTAFAEELELMVLEDRGYVSSSFRTLMNSRPYLKISSPTFFLNGAFKLVDRDGKATSVKTRKGKFSTEVHMQRQPAKQMTHWLIHDPSPLNSDLPVTTLLDKDENVILMTDEKKSSSSKDAYYFYNRYNELTATVIRADRDLSNKKKPSQFGTTLSNRAKQNGQPPRFDISINDKRFDTQLTEDVLRALVSFAVLKLNEEAFSVRYLWAKRAAMAGAAVGVLALGVVFVKKGQQHAIRIAQENRQMLPIRLEAALNTLRATSPDDPNYARLQRVVQDLEMARYGIRNRGEFAIFAHAPFLQPYYFEFPYNDLMTTEEFREVVNQNNLYEQGLITFLDAPENRTALSLVPRESRGLYLSAAHEHDWAAAPVDYNTWLPAPNP